MSQKSSRRSEFTARDAECVVTGDRIPGIGVPAVVVADRWGEIIHLASASRVEQLTPPEDLLDWVDYVVKRCPECEGESK